VNESCLTDESCHIYHGDYRKLAAASSSDMDMTESCHVNESRHMNESCYMIESCYMNESRHTSDE